MYNNSSFQLWLYSIVHSRSVLENGMSHLAFNPPPPTWGVPQRHFQHQWHFLLHSSKWQNLCVRIVKTSSENNCSPFFPDSQIWMSASCRVYVLMETVWTLWAATGVCVNLAMSPTPRSPHAYVSPAGMSSHCSTVTLSFIHTQSIQQQGGRLNNKCYIEFVFWSLLWRFAYFSPPWVRYFSSPSDGRYCEMYG